MALPTLYDLNDPTSNLAGSPCSDPLGELAALMGNGLAADRLMLPPIIEENRFEWGERWALPFLVGVSHWLSTGRLLPTALWTLGTYMAPMPVALMEGFRAARAAGAFSQRSLGEGGEGYGVGPVFPPRRRICCGKYRRLPNGKLRCIRRRPC